MRKHLNKRAIRGREVKGFTFNKRCAKTTLSLKRCALKGMYKALCKCLLMSVCVCIAFVHVFVCVHATYTHTHTQGWFIPSTGQVNWSRPFRLVFGSRSNESSVSRPSKQCLLSLKSPSTRLQPSHSTLDLWPAAATTVKGLRLWNGCLILSLLCL